MYRRLVRSKVVDCLLQQYLCWPFVLHRNCFERATKIPVNLTHTCFAVFNTSAFLEQHIRQCKHDAVKWLVPLSYEVQLLIQHTQQGFKFLAASSNAKNLIEFVLPNDFGLLGVSSQRNP